MLKKTITYTDYNGNDRTESFYFNLTKSELAEMDFGVNGGFDKMIERIIEKQDGATIIRTFKDLLMRAYGEKDLDGKRFRKSEEISLAFTQTEAYDQLFMELVTDAKAAADFIKGVMPDDIKIPEDTVPELTALTD